jgi:type I restriction-modification system DNA methylase subunit
MDAAAYKHVVLGLIFLKYIFDAFEEYHTRLEAERDEGADPEDPDEYRAFNTFWRGDHSKFFLLHIGEGKGEGVYNDIPGFLQSRHAGGHP